MSQLPQSYQSYLSVLYGYTRVGDCLSKEKLIAIAERGNNNLTGDQKIDTDSTEFNSFF